MSNRELLKMAAKAAEYEASALWWIDGVLYFYGDKKKPWNPLDDDGDALRLAVKLGIDIFPWRNKSQDQQTVGVEAAVRIAIVRAAAEIGRKMQNGGAA